MTSIGYSDGLFQQQNNCQPQNQHFRHQYSSLQKEQLPPICGAKQLCKLKRFFTSLFSISSKISPKVDLHVKELCLSLVVR